MNDFEHELSQSLRHQADGLTPTGLTMEQVQGRATRIRRRRYAASALGAAAMVGVLVPTTMLLTPNGDTPGPDPIVAAPTVIPEHARAGSEVLDFTDLPAGEASLLNYLDLRGDEPVLVSPAGERTTLQLEGEPRSFVTLADGRHVVWTDQLGEGEVEVVDAEGALESVQPSNAGLVVDADYRQAAWADPQGGVQVLVPGEQEPVTLGTVADATLEVVDLTGDCLEEVLPGGSGGCVVHANATYADGSVQPLVVTREGVFEANSEGIFMVVDDFVTAGDPQSQRYLSYLAGVREVRPAGTCSGVFGVDEESGESTWLVKTCEHTFDDFSPDAHKVLAWEGYGDGIGHYVVGMYDLTTRKLLWARDRAGSGMSFVHSAVWEDQDHLLAPVWQDGQWLLVRFGPDGALEQVTEPADGEDVEPAYLVETQH